MSGKKAQALAQAATEKILAGLGATDAEAKQYIADAIQEGMREALEYAEHDSKCHIKLFRCGRALPASFGDKQVYCRQPRTHKDECSPDEPGCSCGLAALMEEQ